MEAYTYAEFGTFLDTRRLASGAVVVLAKGAVSWGSKMQGVTASGTSEADYVATPEEVKEVIFLKQVQDFIERLMRIGAADMFEHKEEAIQLAVNTYASRKTKRIDAKHHLVRDGCDAGKVRVVYVKTEDQHADLFAKSLDMQAFYKYARQSSIQWYAIQMLRYTLSAANVFWAMFFRRNYRL